MTLDEAIKHSEEVAEEKEKQAWESQLQEEYEKIKPCKKCAEEHRQLAEWLKELKQLREQTKWIPVSERLPKVNQRVLVTSYGRVCYAMMISADGNSGHPVFKLQDSLNERVVCETTVHSEFTTNRITAWMPLPKQYNPEENKE
jgi:biotin-(acetyl-CoA carboxylase) ligase